jgi:FtsP/CotA-like multicopper oxidase with cupredoxin domain
MSRNLIVIVCAVAAGHAQVCPRPSSGSTVVAPEELSSSNGRLKVSFAFRSEVDDDGLTRYCYVTDTKIEAPTLRVKPGDDVVIEVKNELTPAAGTSPEHRHKSNSCSGGPMTALSTNLHFHALAIPPTRHQDDVIHTAIQPSGPAFRYQFKIPTDQPPGLYWYHPHPHGYSEGQVLGGASGALIVEGIAESKPEVAGLPERLLILRDQRILGPANLPHDQDNATGKDISLNFVPVMYPLYMPTVMRVEADGR